MQNNDNLTPMEIGQMLLGENEAEAENNTEAEGTETQPTQEAEQAQPVIPQVPPTQEQVPPAPVGMTKEEYQALLESVMEQRLAPIEEKLKPRTTEEEVDPQIEELKKRLGLEAYDEKIKAQEAKIAEQEAKLAEQARIEEIRAETAKQAQLQADITKFKEGKSENAESVVMDELNKIAQNDPQLAAQFDNPIGWNLIYQAKIGQAQPIATPDPIIPTGNQTTTPSESAFDKAKKGITVSTVELGKELLAMSGGVQ